MRTTITIEQHRETVISEVRCGDQGVRDSQSPAYPDRNDQADSQGLVIEVAPVSDKTTAAKLKP